MPIARTFLSTLALAAVLSAPPVFSSGGGGGGGGGGGSYGVPSSLPRQSRPRDPETELYNEGKQVAKKKLLCRSCPLAKQDLDTELATRILQEPALTESLDEYERGVLEVYLERRFELK